MRALRTGSLLRVFLLAGLGALGCGGSGGGGRDAGSDGAADAGPDATDAGEEAGPPLECEAPILDCNGRRSDGCEADIRSSTDHCGECGNRCQAPGSIARCVMGTCEYSCATGFADCNEEPEDGCEAALSAPATCGACDRACPTSPPSLCVASAYCRHQVDNGNVDDLFLDPAGEKIYYVQNREAIRVYDVATTEWTRIYRADNDVIIGAAFVFDDFVWFVNRTAGELQRLPLAGGDAESFTAVDETLSRPIVIGSDVVLLSDAGELYRIALDMSDTPELIASGMTGTIPAADGNAILWSDAGSLFSQPISGAAPDELAEGDARSVAVAGNFVWFTMVEGGKGSVRRVPRAGGTVETVAEDLGDVRAIALDADWIYVSVSSAADPKLLRIPRDGGEPEQIDAPAGVHEIIPLGESVLWASTTGGFGATQIAP